MRRLQRLWGSVSVLTAAVLAGICFLRGSTQRIFLVGVFALWIAYSFAVFLMPVIKRYKYRRNLRKIRKKPQNHSGSNGAELQRLYYLLLCNANHRITGYIKSIYPEAVWKWETAAPEKVMKDYIVESSKLYMDAENGNPLIRIFDGEGNDRILPLGIGVYAHRQLASYLSIPQNYYNLMLEEKPELLSVNVNEWLAGSKDRRMLRTLDGEARAFLSDRYKRIDNYDIAQATLPIISEIPDVQIVSCNLTPGKMYIKALNPRLFDDVCPGDTVQAGIIISNSEVGLGAVNIQPLVYRLVCENGMVINDAVNRKTHLGPTISDNEIFYYSKETVETDDKAFLLKIKDSVRAAVDETRFRMAVEDMRIAKSTPMNTAGVPEFVRLTSRTFGITENEEKGVLQHLIEGGDLSLYGLANAVTRFSQDVDSYDRATDLESIGYKILTMPKKQWSRINSMAA